MAVTVIYFTFIIWFEAGFSFLLSWFSFFIFFAMLIILASSTVEKLSSFPNVMETVRFTGFHTGWSKIYCYLTVYYKNHP